MKTLKQEKLCCEIEFILNLKVSFPTFANFLSFKEMTYQVLFTTILEKANLVNKAQVINKVSSRTRNIPYQ